MGAGPLKSSPWRGFQTSQVDFRGRHKDVLNGTPLAKIIKCRVELGQSGSRNQHYWARGASTAVWCSEPRSLAGQPTSPLDVGEAVAKGPEWDAIPDKAAQPAHSLRGR